MRARWLILWCTLAMLAACGFGFYGGGGAPYPGPDYWGWQCADGTQYDPDAGCPDAGVDGG
jgi:hypothetical protein